MSLNDRAEVVAVAKLAGLLDVSNEMISDAAINLTAQFTTLLRDSLSRQLDDGLLFGGGPPAPKGVVATAAEAAGADLLEAVLTAARVDRRRGRHGHDPGRVRGGARRR